MAKLSGFALSCLSRRARFSTPIVCRVCLSTAWRHVFVRRRLAVVKCGAARAALARRRACAAGGWRRMASARRIGHSCRKPPEAAAKPHQDIGISELTSTRASTTSLGFARGLPIVLRMKVARAMAMAYYIGSSSWSDAAQAHRLCQARRR